MRFPILLATAVLVGAGSLAPDAGAAGEPLTGRPGVQTGPAAARSLAAGAVPSALVRADTLRYRVRAGDPLLVSLPPTHRGAPTRYRLLYAPALSWLVDRSFFWRTLPAESGEMPVLVERRIPRADPDTLVLLVDVEGGF